MKNNWLKARRRFGAALLLTLLSLPPLLAQTAQAATATPEMADTLRQNGKIYVVVLVILIILSGLLLYLVRLDRKVGRLERELREEA